MGSRPTNARRSAIQLEERASSDQTVTDFQTPGLPDSTCCGNCGMLNALPLAHTDFLSGGFLRRHRGTVAGPLKSRTTAAVP